MDGKNGSCELHLKFKPWTFPCGQNYVPEEMVHEIKEEIESAVRQAKTKGGTLRVVNICGPREEKSSGRAKLILEKDMRKIECIIRDTIRNAAQGYHNVTIVWN